MEYWMPEVNDVIVVAETPHFIKYIIKKGDKFQIGMMVPNPRRDCLSVDDEYIVDGIHIAQDIHYEYVKVKPKGEYLIGLNIIELEIPLGYFRKK